MDARVREESKLKNVIIRGMSYEHVFVCGAGTLKGNGFPLGHELVSSIVKRLASEEQRDQLTKSCSIPVDQVTLFWQSLRKADPSSIDAWVHKNPRFRDLAKICISRELMPYEENERFAEQV